MNFILEQFLFYFAIVTVLFLPGWFLMRAIFGKNKAKNTKDSLYFLKTMGAIEKFVISFGLSIVSIDFLMILMGRFGILLTRESILIAIFLFSFICWIFIKNLEFRISNFESNINDKIFKKNSTQQSERKSVIKSLFNLKLNQNSKFPALGWSAWGGKIQNSILIILILFLTIFIKTTYLQNTIFPTSTDLGHHMYWSKQISQTGKIPIYEKIKLKKINGAYQLTNPQPIADFIIGEHLIFTAIGLISGISFISYFPTLVLFLINIMGLLAIFILTLRMFPKNKKIAIFTLLLLGPLWAISSPQTKFVSGGVIGNLLGNLFIPLCLYFYFLAFTKKSSSMLTTALFLTMGLFYTHHLSGFIFLFIIIFIIITFLGLLLIDYFNSFRLTFLKSWIAKISNFHYRPKRNSNFRDDKVREIKNYLKLFLSPSVIIFLILASCFLLLIYTPAYLQTSAVDTAVGTVTKATRAGLTFTQFKYAVGEPRLALALFGLLILLIQFIKKNKFKSFKSFLFISFRFSFLTGWFIAVAIMTLRPQWLNLNIPSGRLGNYVAFPAIILGAYAFYQIFYKSKKYIPSKILIIAFSLLFVSLLSFGFYDNSQSLTSKPNTKKALQTFHASNYLKPYLKKYKQNPVVVVKDHNYLKADSWIKLFFMQDYSLPFSRSYFKRYNDPTKPREMCTLWMISEPASTRTQKCYNETNTKFIILNPKFDSAQFDVSKKFQKIYAGNDIAIYYNPEN